MPVVTNNQIVRYAAYVSIRPFKIFPQSAEFSRAAPRHNRWGKVVVSSADF